MSSAVSVDSAVTLVTSSDDFASVVYLEASAIDVKCATIGRNDTFVINYSIGKVATTCRSCITEVETVLNTRDSSAFFVSNGSVEANTVYETDTSSGAAVALRVDDA